jgi:hypothetical protein
VSIDEFSGAGDMVPDLVVAHSNHSQPELLQEGGTGGVLLRLTFMDLAVHFDYQTGISPVEVHDVRSNRMLTPEFEAPDASSAQVLPQSSLGLCSH